ncbi:MAG: helix-turn-helix domain-containing protein [Sphingomicrobium sp.]
MRPASQRSKSAAIDPDTRYAIKAAARRLFAERGIDGVSIREIVVLAGQRNGGSVHYHFGSKEALVRELIVDGARLIDDLRNHQLDRITRDGALPSLREVIEVLVSPALHLAEDTYLRFIHTLQMNFRDMFLDALENQWNSGYRRCLAHIRALLPEIPTALLNQRLVFMDIYMTSAMATREASLNDSLRDHRFWKSPSVMANFIDTMEQLLAGPVSAESLATIKPRTKSSSSKTVRSGEEQ